MNLIEHLRSALPNGKILILGWGKEGQSTRQLLSQVWPDQTVWVADQKPQTFADGKTLSHQDYLQNLDQFQVIWKSPGVPSNLPELEAYRQQGGVITSQLDQVLGLYRQKVIGVTGTKGKSTTSTLIHQVLKAAGKSSVLAGNIGTPLFDVYEYFELAEWIVIEMSSYMLESVTTSPHIAVFLNIFPEHLNYHGSLADYIKAKEQIAQFQTASDWLVANQQDAAAAALMQRATAQVKAFRPRLDQEPVRNLSPVVAQQNWPAVLAVAEILQIPKDICDQVAASFTGLPHRLEKVATVNDVTFYDDTLATVPEAAIAALQAVPNVSVMLLGGFDRGIEYDKIVAEIVAKKVPFVFLFPTSGAKMANLFSNYPESERPQYALVQTMEEAVAGALKVAQPGTAVLLSPASPSFSQFQNYEQKSAAFREAITDLTGK